MCGPGVYWCDIFARVVGRRIGQIRHGLARVLCRLTEHFKLASGTHETMAVTHIKELCREAFRIALEQVCHGPEWRWIWGSVNRRVGTRFHNMG